METFSEYTERKKKNKKSFKEHTESVLGITLDDDIAPVRESTSGSSMASNPEEQKDSYLQKGALGDGFSLGNLYKSKKATEADSMSG